MMLKGNLKNYNGSNLTNNLNYCEFCALFTKKSHQSFKRESCSWESPVSHTFCSEKEKGPFAVISPQWSGLHNNWLSIFSGLYFSQVWNETGGTVVLSGSTATRKSFSKEQYAKFQPIDISDIYDTLHIQAYMKTTFGVNLCVAKHNKSKDISDFTTGKAVHEEVKRFSGLNDSHFISFNTSIHNIPGSNASEILKMVPDHPKFVLYNIWPWTNQYRYTSPSLENYNDFHITEMRNAALSICFSKSIRQMSVRILSKIYKFANKNKIIGLHLRLEGDWTQESWSEELSMGVLKEYEEEIISYKTWAPRNVSVYIAHGSLSSSMQKIVNKWLSNLDVQVFRKESLIQEENGTNDLKKMTAEVQAAVDAETLVHLDHFIGYCASSMSYVVKERRKYLGKTNYIVEPSFQPGFDFWYPIFVPENHRYLKENKSIK